MKPWLLKLLRLQMSVLAIIFYGQSQGYDFTAGGLAFIVNDEGTSVSVTRIDDGEDNYSELTSIVIPSSVVHSGKEYPVTGIKTNAFSKCQSVESVTLPGTIVAVGDNAFSDCPKLNKVNVSDLKAWCGIDFANEAANPLYPRYIHTAYGTPPTIFYRYKQLVIDGAESSHLIIPDGIENIKAHAFVGFSGTELTLPSTLKSVGKGAFASCKNLKNIYVSDLTSWLDIDFETASSNPMYGVYDDVIYEWEEETDYSITYTATVTGKLFNQKELYVANTKLTSLVIPEGVTQIKPYTFITNPGYDIASFPSTLSKIGQQALQATYFTDFSGSEEYSGDIKVLIWNAKNCPTTGSINSEGIEHLVIGDGVETLPDNLALGSKIKSISIPASVNNIGKSTFAYCSELRDIYAAPATAPECELSTFADVVMNSVILHTESGAMASYFSAPVWEDFSALYGDLVAASQLTLDKTTANVKRQSTLQLQAIVTPTNASVPVTWHSTDPSIATVDANGMVTGVKNGEVDIIAMCFNKQAVCHVIVADQLVVVTLDQHLLEMNPNEIAVLMPSLSGGNVAITASSSNEQVAMARIADNSKVQVLAIKPGEAIITVRTTTGNCQPDSCRVIVLGNHEVTDDINGDGKVDVGDINLCINAMLGKSTDAAADVNGDGRVDIEDVNQVINAMLGK